MANEKKAIQINIRLSPEGVKLLDTIVETGRRVNGIETRRTVIERLVRKEAASKDPVND